MSNDPFIEKPWDREPGESAGDARIRQREIHEKQMAGRSGYNSGNGSYSPDMTGSYSGPYDSFEFSWLGTYIGVPALFLALIIWLDFIPLGDGFLIFGYAPEALLLCIGLVAIALRFLIGAAGFVAMLLGGAMGIATVLRVRNNPEISWGDVTNNLIVSAVAIVVGYLILRVAAMSRSNIF